MLNRVKIRPRVRLRNAADNLVGGRAASTTVGEHDHSVPQDTPPCRIERGRCEGGFSS
jgi:hypothetical protein